MKLFVYVFPSSVLHSGLDIAFKDWSKQTGDSPRKALEITPGLQNVSYRLHKLELFLRRWKTSREDTDTQTYKKASKEDWKNILCFQWLWWVVQETDGVKIQIRWWTEKKKPTKFWLLKEISIFEEQKRFNWKNYQGFQGHDGLPSTAYYTHVTNGALGSGSKLPSLLQSTYSSTSLCFKSLLKTR